MSETQTPYVIDQQTGEATPNGPGDMMIWTDATSLLPRDDTERILNLPERLVWDKKGGRWQSETLDTTDIEFDLMGAILMWARWSEIVGQPLDIVIDVDQPGPDYSPGVRLLLEIQGLGFYYTELWGLAFQFGQGVVKQARQSGGHVHCVGSRAISTKNGVFQLPVIVR